MLVTTFENNGGNISKNIVKLNLKQNTNHYCIIISSTYVQRKHIFDKPAREDWKLTLKQFTVNEHNSVSLRYCNFNLFLVITRLIHKFKISGWLQGHLSLSSCQDWLNEYQEFLVKVNCLLIVALYNLEAAAPPQKGSIKFYILGYSKEQ